jgi:hypothetical protein
MAQCQFCGGEDKPIHPASGQQYGEPVCTDCFNESFTGPDPTNDEAYPRASRSREFHTAHLTHRGYLSETGYEDDSSPGEPDYESIIEARQEKRAERWNYKDVW